LPSGSGSRSRRSAPSSRSCRPIARLQGTTGLGSRRRGRRGSTTGSRSSSGSGPGSLSASVVAACLWIDARCRTPEIERPGWGRARGTGSGTGPLGDLGVKIARTGMHRQYLSGQRRALQLFSVQRCHPLCHSTGDRARVE
jgi:hypothetical protein